VLGLPPAGRRALSRTWPRGGFSGLISSRPTAPKRRPGATRPRRPVCWARGFLLMVARGGKPPCRQPRRLVLALARRATNRSRTEEVLRVLHPEAKHSTAQRKSSTVPAGSRCLEPPLSGPRQQPAVAGSSRAAACLTQFLAEPMFSPMPEVTVAAAGRLGGPRLRRLRRRRVYAFEGLRAGAGGASGPRRVSAGFRSTANCIPPGQ